MNFAVCRAADTEHVISEKPTLGATLKASIAGRPGPPGSLAEYSERPASLATKDATEIVVLASGRPCRVSWRSAMSNRTRCMRPGSAKNCRSNSHQEDRTIIPAAPSMATPLARASQCPAGTTFSTSTNTASPATQSRFMTPPTNNSAISSQQQPTQ